MLRAADKRLFVSGQVEDVFGGRLGGFPDALPGRMDGILSPPVAGAIGWYDASDLASFDLTGAKIDTWRDKSGSGFDATGAPAAGPPLLGRAHGQFNNREVVWFTSGTLANAPRLTSSCGASDITSTYFIAAMVGNTSIAATLIGSSADGGVRLDVSTAGVFNVTKSDLATLGSLSTPTVSPGVPFVAGVQLTGSDCRMSLGTATPETDAHAQSLTGGRTLVIGHAPTLAATQPGNGCIAEILIYDTTLSDADTALVVAYLMNKWGIS